MSNIKANGLILKQNDYGEANRMLTVFCEGYGIVKASAYGAKSKKGRQTAASQFLSCGTFMLAQGKGDIFTVQAIEPKECFFPIQEDIRALALGTYFADITYAALDMHTPDDGLLRMLLNALYMLAYKDMPPAAVKAVYELRLAMHAGFMPVTDMCAACGGTEGISGFSMGENGMLCRDCTEKIPGAFKVSPACLGAMYYILHAEAKKVFAFQIGDDVQRELGVLSEKYLLGHLDRDFQSLGYYNAVKDFSSGK